MPVACPLVIVVVATKEMVGCRSVPVLTVTGVAETEREVVAATAAALFVVVVLVVFTRGMVIVVAVELRLIVRKAVTLLEDEAPILLLPVACI